MALMLRYTLIVPPYLRPSIAEGQPAPLQYLHKSASSYVTSAPRVRRAASLSVPSCHWQASYPDQTYACAAHPKAAR